MDANIVELGTPINAARRVESNFPSGYRLARDKAGVLSLQGAFHWSEGLNGGIEWRTIPTVEID
jgi:hypothetical protein